MCAVDHLPEHELTLQLTTLKRELRRIGASQPAARVAARQH
jgi:hypothetical protein